MARSRARSKHPKVGSLVEVEYAGKRLATVVEDRGPIGVGGRRLYRVRLQLDSTDEPIFLELPLDELRVVKQAA